MARSNLALPNNISGNFSFRLLNLAWLSLTLRCPYGPEQNHGCQDKQYHHHAQDEQGAMGETVEQSGCHRTGSSAQHAQTRDKAYACGGGIFRQIFGHDGDE